MMTFRLCGGALLLTPLAFFGALIAGLAVAHGPGPYPLFRPAIVCGIISIALAVLALEVKVTSAPRWRTHFRHCALVYPWLVVAAASQGEGLTAALGPLLLATVAVTAGADALVLLLGGSFTT